MRRHLTAAAATPPPLNPFSRRPLCPVCGKLQTLQRSRLAQHNQHVGTALWPAVPLRVSTPQNRLTHVVLVG